MLQSSVYLIVLIDPDVATIAMTGIHLRFKKKIQYVCTRGPDLSLFRQIWRIPSKLADFEGESAKFDGTPANISGSCGLVKRNSKPAH